MNTYTKRLQELNNVSTIKNMIADESYNEYRFRSGLLNMNDEHIYKEYMTNDKNSKKAAYDKMHELFGMDKFENDFYGGLIKYHVDHNTTYNRDIHFVDNANYCFAKIYFRRNASSELIKIIDDFELAEEKKNLDIFLKEIKKHDLFYIDLHGEEVMDGFERLEYLYNEYLDDMFSKFDSVGVHEMLESPTYEKLLQRHSDYTKCIKQEDKESILKEFQRFAINHSENGNTALNKYIA